MGEIIRRKFILRTTDNKIFMLKPNNNNILIYRITDSGKKSEPVSLINMHPGFFADIDINNRIHIAAQDLKGNIFYYRTENDKLVKCQLLRSSSYNSADRSFFILHRDSGPVFFYTVRKQSESILVCQPFLKKRIRTPVPIARIPVSTSPYWICDIGSNNCLILYPKVSGVAVQICAARFSLNSLRITHENIVTSEEANCTSPKCILLKDGSIHMLYTIRKEGKYILKFQKGRCDTMEFLPPVIIASSRYPFSRYNLFLSEGVINVNWLENGNIYYREKSITDYEFREIKTYKSYRNRQLEYYYYKSSNGKSYKTEEPMYTEGTLQQAFRVIPEKSEPIKNVSENRSISESNIVKAITDYLDKLEGSDEMRHKNIKKTVDIITAVSKVLFADDKTDDNQTENKHRVKKKSFSLKKLQHKHKYKLSAEKENL